MDLRTSIYNNDLAQVKKLLSDDPSLANAFIACYDDNPATAHVLHRICDGVFAGKYTDEEGVAIAKIFLDHGAHVNGNEMIENKDTPLIVAASLHAEKVGILYIDHGADIHHKGCEGGTALHWASWTGRYHLVKRLIEEGAGINQRCDTYQSTPLIWALHGYRYGGEGNRHQQVACAKLLLSAGADTTIPNKQGCLPIELLDGTTPELEALLK